MVEWKLQRAFDGRAEEEFQHLCKMRRSRSASRPCHTHSTGSESIKGGAAQPGSSAHHKPRSTREGPRTITADPSSVCIPSSKVREIHIRLQWQPRIQSEIWVLQMLLFSWQQTSRNFDLQLDTATTIKQMVDCKLTSGIQSQENRCIGGIFATIWQQEH